MRKRVTFFIVLPLILGGMCYIFFRTGSWFADIFPTSIKVVPERNLFRFLIAVSPDFLWAFSLGSFLYSFQQYNEKYWFSLLILMLLLFSEWLQLFTSRRFTFDYFDLIAAILAWLLSYSLRNRLYEK